jgi:hypothetical protein
VLPLGTFVAEAPRTMKNALITFLGLGLAASLAGGCAVDDSESVDTLGEALSAGPLPPQDLHIEFAGERQLAVAGEDAATDEQHFYLERRDFGTWVTLKELGPSPGTGRTVAFVDRDVDAEQSHCYRVRVTGDSGTSLSSTVCGRTTPFVYPALSSNLTSYSPVIHTIRHPRPGVLSVLWTNARHSNPELELEIFDGLGGASLGSVRITDNRDDRSAPMSTTFEHLQPGKLYCFVLRRSSASYSQKLCESPHAERTTVDDRDPRAIDAPAMDRVRAPRNGVLEIVVGSPRPRQLLERLEVSSGRRTSLELDTTGKSTFIDTSSLLVDGESYCYRLLVWNDFGSRYSNPACGTTSRNLPARPSNLRVRDQDGLRVDLDWDSALDADDYELHYEGSRPSSGDRDGNKTTSSTGYDFSGLEGYTYCFKVRARNDYGNSDWSNEVCGVHIADDGVTTYSTYLQSAIPDTGYVLYTHTVNPGIGLPARLVKVNVVGSSLYPYVVQFLPPGSPKEDCGTNKGVIIEPGRDLAGADMAAVFGDSRPSTPVTIWACKLFTRGAPEIGNIPVNVTYAR